METQVGGVRRCEGGISVQFRPVPTLLFIHRNIIVVLSFFFKLFSARRAAARAEQSPSDWCADWAAGSASSSAALL